jgi:putative cell wall-binding protein
VIVGGPVSVSPGIEGQLGKLFPGEVERITGSDRYEVSTAVNTRFFPTAEEAFVATGATFADAPRRPSEPRADGRGPRALPLTRRRVAWEA